MTTDAMQENQVSPKAHSVQAPSPEAQLTQAHSAQTQLTQAHSVSAPSAQTPSAQAQLAQAHSVPAQENTGSAKTSGAKAALSLSVTPKAVEMAKQKLAKRGTPNAALRIGIRGGGCSGYSYVLEFSDDPPRERDRVFEFDGLRVYVDPKSLLYLSGTVVDWEQTLMFQGFKFRNPHEASSCGCGQSFSVG